ncbi:hypothetical protein [Paraburkholderia strydomiana]|uniref:hypothetical protein n=1 Tax=Paraburkholderia strydomiana TaxID=1245417 RepID=UPI002864DE48|nr:hypothetical protein [Paraburkholderia strydomiana]MDR7006187.1 hypothetical protein [Paraburkholderia strydomiana]
MLSDFDLDDLRVSVLSTLRHPVPVINGDLGIIDQDAKSFRLSLKIANKFVAPPAATILARQPQSPSSSRSSTLSTYATPTTCRTGEGE